MKRAPQLRKLSSDHHLALRIARDAKKALISGDPNRMANMQADIIQRFHDELEPHFRLEEYYLAKPLKEVAEATLLEQFHNEHTQLRSWINDRHDAASFLAGFGPLLEQHVRFEERAFFETAQALLKETELDELQHACLK